MAVLIPFLYFSVLPAPYASEKISVKNRKGCSAKIPKFFPVVMPRKCLLKLDHQ